jgi:hypothetical protein
MNKQEIAEKIKQTEEQLASLRAELEEDYPTLESSKAGDKLENGCIVVHKFEDVRMALIAAPKSTEVCCKWNNKFFDAFNALELKGFNPTQWFIPTGEMLTLAYKNCKEHFTFYNYWSSNEVNYAISWGMNFPNGILFNGDNNNKYCVRAFSLVSY